MKTKKCKCVNPKLVFKKYRFQTGNVAYRSTCEACGLVRGWYDGKNYQIVARNSPKLKGGDNCKT